MATDATLRVVFDSIGNDTFEDSLASLARRGILVVYGQSSGPVPPFDIRGRSLRARCS